LLNKYPEYFQVKGLCTHFAGAESIANFVRIQYQIQRFKEIDKFLAGHGIKPEIKHTACSAAVIAYPETRMDMVRIGILQYGFWPSKETFIHYIHDKVNKRDPLQRVLKWKSEVMAVKKVKQGEFIGYGNNFMAYTDMKIAIIPIGYSDGYSRNLSNQGKVLINGERISIVGMVNMNMIIANVCKLPDVKPGDEVIIIGKQGKNQLSVASFSEMTNQVNYELLTRLPYQIKRQKI
jgi:alanine racemase